MHSPHEISLLDKRSEACPGRSSQAASVLRFEHVNVSFDDKPALIDISFDVKTGETIVLFGAAGSGKTVLLKTAIGLIQPARGRVCLFGRNIAELPEEELFPLRHCVGMLFQEGGLFDSLTVEENVAYPLLYQRDLKVEEAGVRARAKEALDFVDLGTVMEKYPSELSGGMRRRVGIARAIVSKPTLVLYDSPTGGLDPVTAYRIIALLIRQRDTQNTASLVVTHRYQDGHLLANCRYHPPSGKLIPAGDVSLRTRFFVLREGRLAFQGSEAELDSSTDLYVAKFAAKEARALARSSRNRRTVAP